MEGARSKRVLIVGAAGMLGNAVLRFFWQSEGYQTFGSVRSAEAMKRLPEELHSRIVTDIDVENVDSLARLFSSVRPDLVINCVGVVKQLAHAEEPLAVIPLNALLPHRLSRLCELSGSRLVHLSTDCVFSGSKGMYTEDDIPDATDLYGRSKYLGEVDYPHALTLRTSIIGHELGGARSLIGWFLNQQGSVRGFRRAVFSGLPTVEIARVIRDFVVPRGDLRGVYHLSAEPINKFELLKLVAQIYGKEIEIQPDDEMVIDRSLDSSRFRAKTGFRPIPWPELIWSMHRFG